MKCPKCAYLGFETGDRCKNCGYDFSLLAAPSAPAPDPDLAGHIDDADASRPDLSLDRLDRSMADAVREAAAHSDLVIVPDLPPLVTTPPDAALPLFDPDGPDDEPLIPVPSAPRPPLAVRRTPDAPGLRTVPRVATVPEPALNFREDPAVVEELQARPVPVRSGSVSLPPARVIEGSREVGGRRVAAALIDHAILFAIDLAVVYFTLRMAGLDMGGVRVLPLVPLLTFIGLVKVVYFTAFTAVGGQTIGKMATGIRVVAEDGEVDGGRAIRRTFACLLSVLPLGLGLLPAFFGSDRRTLHDRLTHTRVVGLPSH